MIPKSFQYNSHRYQILDTSPNPIDFLKLPNEQTWIVEILLSLLPYIRVVHGRYYVLHFVQKIQLHGVLATVVVFYHSLVKLTA